MTTDHRFSPETTNGGCCFCDCSCGWAGGVYITRADARRAHSDHAAGRPMTVLGKKRTEFLIAPPGSTVDGVA